MTGLVRGAPASDFGPATLTSLAGTAAALTVAVVLGARREV